MHFIKMFLRQNKRRSVFVRIAIPFIILILGLLISLPVNAVTRLTVYTALEAEELEPLRQAFRAENPDVDINWVRDSTGIITAKMLAEIDAGNPQADVFLGTSATSLLVVDSKGWLLPYSPKGLEKLDAKFRDKRNPPHWELMHTQQLSATTLLRQKNIICPNRLHGRIYSNLFTVIIW
jgi:ABC-type thiamine transport system substrate-binding protein